MVTNSYTFKPHAFGKRVTVEVGSSGIKFTRGGKLKKRILFRDIQSFQQYPRGVANDPKEGRFVMQDFIISVRKGRTYRICSASYLGAGKPIECENQTAQFERLTGRIKDFATRVNPDVPLIKGSFGLSIAMMIVSLMGVALTLFAAACALASLDEIQETWMLWVCGVTTGVVMATKCWTLSKIYRPTRTVWRTV